MCALLNFATFDKQCMVSVYADLPGMRKQYQTIWQYVAICSYHIVAIATI